MSTPPLLAELTGLGVRLWVEGERLRFDAPAGVMTPERLAAVREHRAAILAELAPSERDMSAAAIRQRYRDSASLLLSELETLPDLTPEQEQEAAYYRSVVSPLPKRVLAQAKAVA